MITPQVKGHQSQARNEGDQRQARYEAELSSRLGLKAKTIEQALGASNTERGLCSEHAAPIAKGIYAYNGLVTSLSRQLRHESEGWDRVDLAKVLPILMKPSKGVALGVASGNALTGLRGSGKQPSSRYPKGELTKKLVSRNVSDRQIELLERSAFQANEPEDELRGLNLWLLLVYFDKERQEIRYEVSLPERLNARGYVKDWHARITPPDFYDVSDGFVISATRSEDPNEGFGPPEDVPVEPRR